MLKSYWYTTQEILLSSAISQAEVMSLAAASCGTRMYQESRITVSPSTQFKTWCKETLYWKTLDTSNRHSEAAQGS